MKAVIYEKYGSPDVLRLVELELPSPKDNQVLIKIHAVSINGSDKENLLGRPLYARVGGLFRPSNGILGSDIAGTVVAVGKDHSEFKVGDEVFGELPNYHGGFAEFVCTSGATLALKPEGLSFVEAAAIPQAGSIAFRGIVREGRVKADQKVLINGAGGSGGSFAIQLAKFQGAVVTGVDNAEKQNFMLSLGADEVLDYREVDFPRVGERFDLILDLVAHYPVSAYLRSLTDEGVCFVVGGSVGVLLQVVLLGALVNRRIDKTIRVLAVPQNREDLLAVTDFVEGGKIWLAIDKTYPLHEVPEAFRYINAGYAKGKIVITL